MYKINSICHTIRNVIILSYHLLFSLHLFYGNALCNLAIQATETNKCDLI